MSESPISRVIKVILLIKIIVIFQDDSRGNYEAFELEEDRDIDNRFIAAMKIDKLEEDDFEEENHILRVETDEDDVEFIITISSGRRCKATQDPGRGDEGFCSENGGGGDDDSEIAGTGCLKIKWLFLTHTPRWEFCGGLKFLKKL